MNIAKQDKKFYLEIPEKGFSPERNKQVVENSIRKFEVLRKKKWNQRMEEYRERADASASFLRYSDKMGGHAKLDKYFGRKMLAHLRGESILADMRLMAVRGQTK